jgi:hypothetical protein
MKMGQGETYQVLILKHLKKKLNQKVWNGLYLMKRKPKQVWGCKLMFCVYCEHFKGVEENCEKDKNIWSFKEVLECPYYNYNGGCNDNQSN